MGVYYTLYNYTKKQSFSAGKNYDFEYWIGILKWDDEDKLVAVGDNGSRFYYNLDYPNELEYKEWDSQEIWDFVKFAAQKFGYEPLKLFNEYASNLTDFVHIHADQVSQHTITQVEEDEVSKLSI